eukprot:GFYU01006451.1.p2 GENE.GFYU01006451.1~~GFYU01006451.1.p2  ORF type:complete len:116 (-),score=40.26 GFYU01006451.1:57-404(-)
MSDTAAVTKQIRIKTGVLKRSVKELASYEKEKAQQEGKIEKMRAEGAGEHDIKKQQEVLEETLVVLPECKTRIATAADDLKRAMTNCEGDEGVTGSEEYTAAQAELDAYEASQSA